MAVLCVSLLGNRECSEFDGSVSSPRGLDAVRRKCEAQPWPISTGGRTDTVVQQQQRIRVQLHWLGVVGGRV